MGNLFELSFWFDVYPLPFNRATYYIIVAVLLLAIGLGIVAKILQSKNTDKLVKNFWSKLARFGFSGGIVGLILVFLKDQRAPYLGMRLWLVLWLLVCFVWLLFILKHVFLEIPRLRERLKQKAEFEKYLPK